MESNAQHNRERQNFDKAMRGVLTVPKEQPQLCLCVKSIIAFPFPWMHWLS